jgi:Reverse transcriptase (RNA-dependent DNA polymerase)
MSDNGRISQRDIMAMDPPAPAGSTELLPAPPEGDMVQGDPGYDIDFGDSGLEDYSNNMEFGTRLDDDTVASSLGGDEATLRRSNRLRKPSWKVRDNIEQGDIALPAAYEVLATYFEPEIADEMMDPIAFLAKSDPDTLYYHQAMKAKDAKEFRMAMQGKIDSHCDNDHWEIIKRTKVPEGVKVLDSVWAMRRKRRIKTKEIYKWKARLNIHGGQQEYGVNYWETFSPMVTWVSIRLVLILSILLSWHTRQIDFMLAYPQAPIETPLYMEVPKGVTLNGLPRESQDYVLQLKKNLYGQKQAGQVWYKYLRAGLEDIGFTPSLIDECVYYHGGMLFLVYVDDGIIAGPDPKAI